MAQMNYLNLADTYGRGVAEKEAESFNALKVDALKSEQKRAQQQFSADQQRANTEMLLAGIQNIKRNPQAVSQVASQLAQAGVLDKSQVPQLLQGFQANPQAAMQELDKMEAGLMTALGQSPAAAPADPNSIREYKYAVEQGFTGTFADWKDNNKGGVTVNQFPAPQAGYRYNLDDQGRPVSMSPMPGGPVEREELAAKEKETRRREQETRAADLMVDEIDRAFERISPSREGVPATGKPGALMAAAPSFIKAGSNRAQLESIVETITANIGFNRLQQMRANSPTGGALGNVSDGERRALNATAGNLDPSQPDYMFAYNLSRLYNQYNDTIHGKGQWAGRMMAPESDYRVIYEDPSPEKLARFYQGHGYLPPGFTLPDGQ